VLATIAPRFAAGPLRVSLTGRYVGSFFLDNTEDNRRNPAARQQPGYEPLVNPAATIVDVAGQLKAGRWFTGPLGLSEGTLDLRVNNLLDRRYTAFGYADYPGPAFIPAATRNFYAGITLGL
jgi:outer membrane receptor protein involved in Fe transport